MPDVDARDIRSFGLWPAMQLALNCCSTTISGDDCACDVASPGRGEKPDNFSDLRCVRSTLEQGGGSQCRSALGCRSLGINRAGGDGVHPYAAGTELRGPGTVMEERLAFVAPYAAPPARPI